MSTSGSKSNEHVAHFLVDIHTKERFALCPSPNGVLMFSMKLFLSLMLKGDSFRPLTGS